MPDFSSGSSSGSPCLSGCERREVIVENEWFCPLDQNLVHLLHVQLGAQGYGCKALGLAAGEDCASVCARQIVNLAPDRAHVCGCTTVQTAAFIDDEVSHGLLLDGCIITVDHCGLFLSLLLRDGLHELFLEGVESLGPFLLWQSALCYLVAAVIAELCTSLADCLVVDLVAILSLYALSNSIGELLENSAVLLDFLMGEHDGSEHNILGNFLHFSLDHHYVLGGCSNHKFQVCSLQILESRIDAVLAVYAGNPDLGNRSVERYIGNCQGACCGKTCQSVRLGVLVC